MVNYKEISCKSACNKIKRKMPYKWDLNIYRGCSHSCVYCYALYSHKYLDSDSFFDDVFIKTNIVDCLQKQLSKKSWKKEVICIGTVCDSYQTIEEDYELMPQILELCIKYKNPIIISTKSDLILRDYDLIEELADLTQVNIASTITISDEIDFNGENLRSLIETNAISSSKRFNFLKKFKNTSASTGLHMMPILPYINDSNKNINSLFSQASDTNVDYVLYGALNLYGKTRANYLNFLKSLSKDIYKKTLALYSSNPFPNKEYKRQIYSKIYKLRKKYNLSSNYMGIIKNKIEKNEGKQLTLFDEKFLN